MALYAGTSGYSYKEWKGTFYPDKLPAEEMLHYYATQLPAVEINNTFYRLPRASVVDAWAQQVPDDFRFVIKASRRITHFKRLRDTRDETEYLLRTISGLGDRLGVVLFQLPPNLKKDVERLEDFLDELPKGTRAAFEFRHDTWRDDDVYELLRGRNLALCVADNEGDTMPELVRTADWGYLRLRRPNYRKPQLSAWIERVRAQDWKEAYVFFKHEDGNAGPAMARRFLELAEQA
ncbi:MAG: DUF72 domain-containing protein [Candidatus Krumholzibacteria bacterium]